MQRWQIPFLGRSRIPAQLSPFEVEQLFTLTNKELEAIRTRRGALNRLGVALQLGFLRLTGRQLNSVHVLPQAVLTHLARQLAIEAPDIASIRALYRRERTLYEHQNFAADLLGFRPLHAPGERGLVAHLRREAATVYSPHALLSSAYRWLYEHRYFIPRRRRIQDRIRESIRHSEKQFLTTIDAEVPAEKRDAWWRALRSVNPKKHNMSVAEWLRTAPRLKSSKQLSNELDKLRFLRSLGVDAIRLDTIPIERLRVYAQRMTRRKLSQVNNQREPIRSIELVCFMR